MKPNIYKDSHIQKLKGTTNIGKKKKEKNETVNIKFFSFSNTWSEIQSQK